MDNRTKLLLIGGAAGAAWLLTRKSAAVTEVAPPETPANGAGPALTPVTSRGKSVTRPETGEVIEPATTAPPSAPTPPPDRSPQRPAVRVPQPRAAAPAVTRVSAPALTPVRTTTAATPAPVDESRVAAPARAAPPVVRQERATPVEAVSTPKAAVSGKMAVERRALQKATAERASTVAVKTAAGMRGLGMYAEKFGTMVNRMQWRPPELKIVTPPGRYSRGSMTPATMIPVGGAQSAVGQEVGSFLKKAGLNGMEIDVSARPLRGLGEVGPVVKPATNEYDALTAGLTAAGSIFGSLFGGGSKGGGQPAQAYVPASSGGSGGLDAGSIAAIIAATRPPPEAKTDYTPWVIGGVAVLGIGALALVLMK